MSGYTSYAIIGNTLARIGTGPVAEELASEIAGLWLEDDGSPQSYVILDNARAYGVAFLTTHPDDSTVCVTAWENGDTSRRRVTYIMNPDDTYNRTVITELDELLEPLPGADLPEPTAKTYIAAPHRLAIVTA